VGGILDELVADPHPVLARMRASSPATWVPELGGWLVTGYAAAAGVLADDRGYTVDDPRFTTARVTGPSMLSLDGAQHARHRTAFAGAFRAADTERWLGGFIRAEASRLTGAIRPAGRAELRTAFAGPLAAAVMARALGLAFAGITAGTVLAWYRDIVAAVAQLPAAASSPGGPSASGSLAGTAPLAEPSPAEPAAGGPAASASLPGTAPLAEPSPAEPAAGGPAAAVPLAGTPGGTVAVPSFGELASAVRAAASSGRAPLLTGAAREGGLSADEVISNAAVVLFGGIETTEGMICNAATELLSRPGSFGMDELVEESLRMEPAAAVVDRYATRDMTLAGAQVRAGDLVRVSITGANRDPAAFADPDRFDPRRAGAGRHLAFARGPHFCIGAHLARLETVTALRALRSGLPGLRLDPGYPPPEVRGLVFRKPAELRVRWG
jgi:cytochrome P450